MKAAVLKKPYILEVEEVPRFPLESGWVTVAVEYCGICGSDIRYYQGENPWALHTRGESTPSPPNIILGHEFCGEVVEVASAEHEHLMGKRVAVVPYDICGTCKMCRRGWHHLCPHMIHLGHGAGWGKRPYYPGGMAEFCPVWAKRCYPLPDSVESRHAAVLDMIGVAIHAVLLAQMAPQSKVAVIGAGPIGLTIAQIARSWGARRVFVADIHDLPLQIAEKMGIKERYRADEDDVVAGVMELTDSQGVDIVWDTAGSDQSFALGIGLLAPRGRLINLATHKTEYPLDLSALAAERYIRSSANYLLEEFPIAMDLLAVQAIDMEPIITHRLPLDEVCTAMEGLLDKQASGMFKVVIEVNKERR